eukprot:m.7334 g.7334  ORF g.7334 m.7334 type:complete len:575 (-) comp3696_c0_seq2:47-1771(-)
MADLRILFWLAIAVVVTTTGGGAADLRLVVWSFPGSGMHRLVSEVLAPFGFRYVSWKRQFKDKTGKTVIAADVTKYTLADLAQARNEAQVATKLLLLVRDPFDAIWFDGQLNNFTNVTRGQPERWTEYESFVKGRAKGYLDMWKAYQSMIATDAWHYMFLTNENLANLVWHQSKDKFMRVQLKQVFALKFLLSFVNMETTNAKLVHQKEFQLNLRADGPIGKPIASTEPFYTDAIICEIWNDYIKEAIKISQKLKYNLEYKPPRACHEHLKNGKYAVMICGIMKRQYLEDLAQYFVKPLVDRGGTVDIYYSLINLTDFTPYKGSSADFHHMKRFHKDEFAASITAAGGDVKLGEIREQDFVIDEDFRNITADLMGYATPRGKGCKGQGILGCSVLRRFACARSLYDRAKENADYDIYVLIREDAGLVDPVRFDIALGVDGDYHNTVFTRGCCEFYGISDKALVMGKNAAQSLLSNFHELFYNHKKYKYNKNRFNPESYLVEVMAYLKVHHRRIDFNFLPITDMKYERQNHSKPYRCFRRTYFMCPKAYPPQTVKYCNENLRLVNERHVLSCFHQ